MLNPKTPPPYSPAEHLVSGSLLTSSQLVSQFEVFRDSLRYVSVAPELVFERLVANLNDAIASALEAERHLHTTTLQQSQEKQEMLQLSNDKLEEELKQLKEVVSAAAEGHGLEVVQSSHKNPAIGTFNTTELRSSSNPCAKNLKVVYFARPYSAPPGLPVGLTLLDINFCATARVQAFANDTKNDRFEVNINSWDDTVLHAAGCAWLEIEANDPDFQFGSYSTWEDPRGHRPHSHNEHKIVFKRPYTIPPTIVVWLSAIDIDSGSNWRVKTYATDVTVTGFTIHIDTWDNTVLYYAASSWVAYPANKTGVRSGSFNTLDVRSVQCPQTYNTGYEGFGNETFTKPPRTLVALNSLDIGTGANMRVMVKATSVSAVGMAWHINSWDNTTLYSAGASYIALS